MFILRVIAAIICLMIVGIAADAQGPTEMAKKGAQAYRLCASCHSLQPGVHLSGPSLAGRWNKRAASGDGYSRYTDAMRKLDLSWDENSLNAWLADPQAMVPGTTMNFRGIKQNETRSDLIEFLREAMAEGGATRVVQDGLISGRMAAGQIPPDLSSVGTDQSIRNIRHCRDAYFVTTANGATLPFWETNVRLKTDGSERGPKVGAPVLLRSGMVGDRVSVVFSSLADIGRLIEEKC